MRAAPFVCSCLLLWTMLGYASSRDQDEKARLGISDQEFAQRRAAVCAGLDTASAALFRAADPKWRNGDVNYPYPVTRTIPVSGVYTPEQAKIYSIVRSAHDEVIKLIKPGLPSRALEEKARQVITDAGYARFILHGVSHQVGLDVHDAGVSDTLRAGMVITVEPGIYIPVEEGSLAKEYRGIGIRLEDDVLVTPTGAEILTAAIPIDPATIEKLMK